MTPRWSAALLPRSIWFTYFFLLFFLFPYLYACMPPPIIQVTLNSIPYDDCPTMSLLKITLVYYYQGEYDNQDPMFRGCAGNYFPHDEKCESQEQAVTIVEGKKSVDVGVTLCYCNKDLCNEELSGALTNRPVGLTVLSALILTILIFFK